MGKINFIPRGSYILVTSNLVKKDHSLILGKTAPEIREVQQVIAVGPEAVGVKEGDWVMLNMQNFIQTVKKQSTIRAGVGGQDMLVEQVVIPFFSVPGDETVYIKINSREIEGIIPNYDALPESIKEFTTLNDFTREQDKMDKEAKELMNKGITYTDMPDPAAPVVRTASSKIKMY